MVFYSASSIDKQWLSTAPHSHVRNLLAKTASIDKHIILFGTSQYFGCKKNPFLLPYLKNPLPYPTFVWLYNFDPPIALTEVNAQGLHRMHKIMFIPHSLVWNFFKFLCLIGSKIYVLLQAFRYDGHKINMVAYAEERWRNATVFFQCFFIPFMISISVFYLIATKTWIRCKLGARCMKQEDILN